MEQPSPLEAAAAVVNPMSALSVTRSAMAGGSVGANPLVGLLLGQIMPQGGIPALLGTLTGTTRAPDLLLNVARTISALDGSDEGLMDALDDQITNAFAVVGVDQLTLSKAVLTAATLMGMNVDASQPNWLPRLIISFCESLSLAPINASPLIADVQALTGSPLCECPACGLNLEGMQ